MHASLKTTAAAALIGALPFVAVTGCDSIEQRTGLSKQTQMGAGAGAAAGGIIAAVANANPAWIAASTILGGVAGGAIGEYLQREDVQAHASNQYESLQSLDEGEVSTWTNPETGHRGSTRVTEVFTMADGTECKNFIEEIDTGERTIQESATACRPPGGEWRVRKA
jgi:surface antigen